MTKYDHHLIEKKWQDIWEKSRPYRVEVDTSKPKYYILDMFPYPSGAGLHVGHVVGYTATDVISRYMRAKGYNVLHPMGWDSFGLPAEQYAIRTGTHPAKTTETNIDNYRRQLKSLGLSYDWDREFATSSPEHYKWTQWIFTKLYEKGLAYEADMLVNWCPALGTVLANEEVEGGRSKEGGHPVIRRPLRQWVLKITAYADRLLEDLDDLDWPEGLKKLQKNWIGRSEGAHVDFPIEGREDKIRIFTTRPDTLFGATFMVLAPEHPLVDQITTEAQVKQINDYQTESAAKSDLVRTEIDNGKSGVFTGAYAINPVTKEEIPIWIADYVLMGYGTGAVMAVPANDERDFDFALQYEIPIRPVIDPDTTTLPHEEFDESKRRMVRQDVKMGRACWSNGGSCINSASDELDINGLSCEEGKDRVISWLEEKSFGSRATSYKLRDWLFSRQRYWGEPIPILHLDDGTKRPLAEDELPLTPPEVSDYTPSGDGLSPLAKVESWVNIKDSKTGKPATREINTMPQWAGSCWYYLRFCDPHNNEAAWDKEKEKYWLPVDLYVGGAEHAVLHLLYARFWHKVLYDLGLVHTKEPFKRLFNQGLMVSKSYQKSSGIYVPEEEAEERDGHYFHKGTGEKLKCQIDKMSKSKLNGVTPDEVIEEFGADALRLYEMFMGPLDKERVWSSDAVSGCRRFLNRFWDMTHSDKVSDEEPSDEALKLTHRLLKGVLEDLDNLQLNTAIAKMMEFINGFTKLDKYPKCSLKVATQLLSPFAPHIAYQVWEDLGFTEDLNSLSYPEVDPKYLIDDVITYVVQVNGKVRGRFDLPKDQPENVILEAAKKEPILQKYLSLGEVVKTIFVPNKLINIVIK